MPKLMVQLSLVNEDRGHTFYEEPALPTDWDEDEVGQLFRYLQREYGRYTGRVHLELPTGPCFPVGWTFQKRVEYDDGHGWRPLPQGQPRTYLQSAWVVVSTQKEEIHVESPESQSNSELG